MGKKIWQTVRKYENIWLYIGFLIITVFLAAARGCWAQYLSVYLYPIMIPAGLSLFMLWFCAYRGANGRILLLVMIMMMLAALMRAVFWTAYPDLFPEGSRLAVPDYLLTLVTIFVVMLVYPLKTSFREKRVYEILASRWFTLVMVLLVAAMYGLLLLSGVSYAGVSAWFSLGGFHIQLTEFIKILFILCLAAMMSRDERTPLALLFWLVNVFLMGFLISEFGTVLVMTVVFFLFLFIFPQKKGIYFILGLIALAVMAAALIFVRIGSSEYDYALEKSDSRVFAAKFAGTLYDYAIHAPDEVVTMDILGEMVTRSLDAMDPKEQAEMGRAFHAIGQQIQDGGLRLSDFAEARDGDVYARVIDILDEKTENGVGQETGKALTDAISEYSAVACLARLCEDPGFRDAYIVQFCRSDIYDVSVLSQAAPTSFLHRIKGTIMSNYTKIMRRVVLPNQALRARFGFTAGDSSVPYQLSAAQSAMRVGGLTGAGSHEFYYVPVMASDMIYSEMVSLYGFGMGFFVLLLFMILFREGMKESAELSGKPFHRGLALGISLTIFVQALIIIGGNLNVFPLTGITLPFISDGTLSMLVFGVMIGILLAISYVPIVEEKEAAGLLGEEQLGDLPGKLTDTVRGSVWALTRRSGKKSGFGKRRADAGSSGEPEEDAPPAEDTFAEDYNEKGGEEQPAKDPVDGEQAQGGREDSGTLGGQRKRRTKYTKW